MGDFLFIIILFAVFYFLLIRPQQKRAKEHRNMVEALAKGEWILTGNTKRAALPLGCTPRR